MAHINNTFLRRDGNNSMNADLNLNKHRLINLSEPTAADDAVTRQYVSDTFLKLYGSNAMTGNIYVSKHRLVNLDDPVALHDAVNLKFLDRFLKHDGSSQLTGTLNVGGYILVGQRWLYSQCCPTSFDRGFSD
jgi:hypothetical protein